MSSNVRLLNLQAAAQPQLRLRSAAVATRGSSVLLHRFDGDTFWSLPGGSIEPGESAHDALVREFSEELDFVVSVGELLWVVENFFIYAGTRFHEVGLYFNAQVPDHALRSSDGQPFRAAEPKLEFMWVTRGAVPLLQVRPAVLAPMLSASTYSFAHRVQRDTAI